MQTRSNSENFIYAHAGLILGGLIGTLETPSVGFLHSTGPLTSGHVTAEALTDFFYCSFRCCFRRRAGGGDPHLHRQAAG